MTEGRRKARYRALPPENIREGLRGRMSSRRFALLTGSDPRRVDRWKTGEEDAPHWVALVLTLFTLPDAVELAYKLYDALGEKGRLDSPDEGEDA
jgi:hypothetical protein